MLSRNLYKSKKSPLADNRKKAIFSLVLAFSLFFIVYGVYSFTKMGTSTGQKEVLKQDIGDRPLKTSTFVYINADGGLNLRKDRDQKSAKLILIPNKTKLEVTEELDGWLHVSYSGKDGWVLKQYTTQDEPAADPYKDWTTFLGVGYKIKYGNGWKAKDYGANDALKASSVVAFSNQDLATTIPVGSDFIAPVVVSVSTKTIDDAKNSYATISGVQSEVLQVSGTAATKYVYTSATSNTQQTAVVLGAGSKVFVFTEGGGYQDDLLNMLKTFSIGG